MIDVEFWGCDLEILQLFLKVWLPTFEPFVIQSALLFRGWKPNFQKWLQNSKVAALKFNLDRPLTLMASIMAYANFSANNLNFHSRWGGSDRIQAIFLNIFYFIITKCWPHKILTKRIMQCQFFAAMALKFLFTNLSHILSLSFFVMLSIFYILK